MTATVSGPPNVPAASLRFRHWLIIFSFFVLVVTPIIVACWYLWARASDRYISTVGFSVRTEEVGSAIEMLGGIAELSGSSSSDTEVLYDFIQSQELVADIDTRLDLRGLWSKGDPETDPLFAYDPPGTIEDLVDYWRRMVNVYNDGTGLLELQVQAFTPEDAQQIAQDIYDESTAMINRLSAIAREDATRYARTELEKAETRLSNARRELTLFRNETQIVDPAASVQTQMGLLSSLQSQLSEALVDLDILLQTVSRSDPRISQLQRRVTVITERIEAEREKLGISTIDGTGSPVFADLIGDFERLAAERDFAQEAYNAARAAFDAAQAEARRQSRYLAAHIRPTLAESSKQPKRYTLLALTALFSFLSWAILVLAVYALRDRS
ncbi:MAG: capsule biosynthesis protein [Pseudomonadota bacterium]